MGSKYTEEFRRNAVRTVSKGNVTVTEAARKLGINYKTLREWCRQAKLEKNYQSFISLYREHRNKRSIVSLHDYLLFLEDIGISHSTPMNYSDFTICFEFASKSESTIIDDCVSLLRKSAQAGYFVAGEKDYAIGLGVSDVEDWYAESYEETFKKGKFHLIDEDNTDSGVYKIISQKEFIDFYSFYLENCQIEGDYLEELVEWDSCGEFIADNFKQEFIQDMNKILPNFMVIEWNGNAYDVPDFGVSYYVIFGYNPKSKRGECLFFDDVCY